MKPDQWNDHQNEKGLSDPPCSALLKRWKAVEPPYPVPGFPESSIEDLSIITEDDSKEVIGCSEWMRAEREVFEHICKLHNDFIEQNDKAVVADRGEDLR